MKKLFVIFLLMLFSLPCFAEYKPIPKELSKQYRVEITQIIDTQYPIAVHETEEVSQNAHNMYLAVLENGNLYSDYYDANFDTRIDSPIFNIYKQILFKTVDYAKLSPEDIPATSYSGAIDEFLTPYFKDNNIKIDKLYSLGTLANIKQIEIENEQQELYNLYGN